MQLELLSVVMAITCLLLLRMDGTLWQNFIVLRFYERCTVTVVPNNLGAIYNETFYYQLNWHLCNLGIY